MNSLAIAVLLAPAVATQLAAPRPVDAAQAATGGMSPAAEKYLRDAIALFRTQHMNRDKVDWTKVTSEALAKAQGAQVPADTYPAINLIIQRLGEKHTFLITPDQEQAMETGATSGAVEAVKADLPESERLAPGPTIIRLPAFSGSKQEGVQYADAARRALRAAERGGSCGIIIDLRFNTGGNMWPMLNGLSGLLRDGVLGSFDLASGRANWINRQGRIAEADSSDQGSFGRPVPLRNPDMPVALLIGRSTKSSAEFTAMAFKGRPHTRFFGQPTGGYVSVNDSKQLSDGAVIAMSVGYARDRLGRSYTRRIEPDLETQGGGPTLDAALRWLAESGCGLTRKRGAIR